MPMCIYRRVAVSRCQEVVQSVQMPAYGPRSHDVTIAKNFVLRGGGTPRSEQPRKEENKTQASYARGVTAQRRAQRAAIQQRQRARRRAAARHARRPPAPRHVPQVRVLQRTCHATRGLFIHTPLYVQKGKYRHIHREGRTAEGGSLSLFRLGKLLPAYAHAWLEREEGRTWEKVCV